MLLFSALAALVLMQDPASGVAQKHQGKPADASAVKEWSNGTARDAIKKFKRAMKGRKVPLAQRLEAVGDLAGGSNNLLVKPLLEVVQTDAAVTVRRAAATGLGNQPAKKASRAIVGLLQRDKQDPATTAALIDALAKTGYDRRDWKHVEKLFAKDYDPKYVRVQKSILALVTKTKEKQAWRLLCDNVDEPAPEDVHGAANPPASYWEARWKAWRAWRAEVKQALFVLTEHRFATGKEARIWIEANGAKIGLR